MTLCFCTGSRMWSCLIKSVDYRLQRYSCDRVYSGYCSDQTLGKYLKLSSHFWGEGVTSRYRPLRGSRRNRNCTLMARRELCFQSVGHERRGDEKGQWSGLGPSRGHTDLWVAHYTAIFVSWIRIRCQIHNIAVKHSEFTKLKNCGRVGKSREKSNWG